MGAAKLDSGRHGGANAGSPPGRVLFCHAGSGPAEHEKSEPPSPRDEPTARRLAVTWGIYCQVHRFARAAVLLGDNGMGQEGVVLVRTMLEHTVVLHWSGTARYRGVPRHPSKHGANTDVTEATRWAGRSMDRPFTILGLTS